MAAIKNGGTFYRLVKSSQSGDCGEANVMAFLKKPLFLFKATNKTALLVFDLSIIVHLSFSFFSESSFGVGKFLEPCWIFNAL